MRRHWNEFVNLFGPYYRTATISFREHDMLSKGQTSSPRKVVKLIFIRFVKLGSSWMEGVILG
jgi:hypothetical protein